MSKYLFIESRDPFEVPDTRQTYELANTLAQDGHEVTVYLVQNGVLATRAQAHALAPLANANTVKVLADHYSLQERGVRVDELASNVTVSNVDTLVDLLADRSTKAIWH